MNLLARLADFQIHSIEQPVKAGQHGAMARICSQSAPLLKPIISTLFVLDFMAVWNDFTMPLYYLNNSKQWPMTLAVYNFFGAFENSWNLVAVT